jgi:hypothetical protein
VLHALHNPSAGALTRAALAAITTHLQHCPTCREASLRPPPTCTPDDPDDGRIVITWDERAEDELLK